ncbi:LysR family transcriptional regulator [Agromyces mangrovi Wang et al. 2018]|uniref:LysR family transcriptional regulator n=1 Tax=Agromyces mangrovi TaxID=1858653 RepID=UPI002573BDA2|nr:LysR family transcriptional regulator [Agromyces mangrovi]BDZ65128.1 LysR family transcriptional regulator [Agromyces mangrovi]
MIDPQGLRALVGVAQHGSVAAAAEALGYTPSAVSQQVKRLEGELGDALLERRGRGVLLTERGRVVAHEGRAVLDAMQQLVAGGAGTGTGAAPVRVASFSTATRGLVGPAVQALRAAEAEAGQEASVPVDLRVSSVDPFEAVVLVDRGDVDLAIVHDWDSVPLVVPDGLVREPVCRDVADVVLWRTHPLATGPTVDRHALVDEAWGSTPRGAICHEALLRLFADLGRVPRIVAEDPDFASLASLAASEVAICLVPRLGRSPLPEGAVAVPLADGSQVRQVSVVTRAARSGSPAIRRVVDALRVAAAGAGSVAGG